MTGQRGIFGARFDDLDIPGERNSWMAIDKATQLRPVATVDLVRITLKHRTELTPHVVVIEHDELGAWINHSRKHRFSFEAEFIGRSELGRA